MHVAVLGAGVIGVTTAYYLSELGHEVTIVDHAQEIASGASGGNGGQLSYSFTDAMAGPALLSKMPAMVAGLNPAFYVRPAITPQFLRWGLGFLSQCTGNKHRQNTVAILKLALKSSVLMREVHERTGFEFCYRRAGKLVLQDSAKALLEAESACALKREYGCDVHVISFNEAMDIEPALKKWPGQYSGAVYSESDEVGDPLAFSTQLLQWLQTNRGTDLKLNTSVDRIVARQGRLAAIETNQGKLQVDAVVVCLGAESNRLLHPLGVKTNIYPMRGYSVTLPSLETSNSVSITDPGSKTVFSRLGDKVRIAGFADFVGFRTGKDADRTQTLVQMAQATAPAIADFTSQQKFEWGGFRPMTPDSRPLLGPTAIEGVHLNTGHGMLGWTLACGSGHAVANAIQS